jgi:hypothetical protein
LTSLRRQPMSLKHTLKKINSTGDVCWRNPLTP